MTQTTTGWLVFIAALGMMCTLLAADVGRLETWSSATTPAFIGNIFAHLGVVIGAFVGGKLIPTERVQTLRTRSTDTQEQA